ncbi:hypothetical protein AAFF_G00280890 [Aldrovandia affinis]|uniref:Uncharacterized protein n=1 Tax=Aldrovandia affinis TaxID=143900 RepID=A0AAD7R9X1_9TELE|nr:hypothetical protein AAFF_G00280890 [Aldrovandia affinis]
MLSWDGLPYEFYKAMREVVGEDLVVVYKECLPPSMRKGVIWLLYKWKGERAPWWVPFPVEREMVRGVGRSGGGSRAVLGGLSGMGEEEGRDVGTAAPDAGG